MAIEETNQNNELKENARESLENFDIENIDIETIKLIEGNMILHFSKYINQFFTEETCVNKILKTNPGPFALLTDITSELEYIKDALSPEKMADYKNLKATIHMLSPFYTTLSKTSHYLTQSSSSPDCLRIIINFNNKMIDSLKETDNFIVKSNNPLIPNTGFLSDIAEFFSIFTEKLMLKKELLDSKSTCKDSEFKPAIVTEKSKSEKERLKLIEKANDLYNQLCQDWIRDLVAQAPYSVRDKYQMFFEKFKTFNETFKMPLSNSTTAGQAKEACTQINNLMNNISSISNQSYSSGMYQ